jgi:exosortase D (VPLPA-CTERM-specific)
MNAPVRPEPAPTNPVVFALLALVAGLLALAGLGLDGLVHMAGYWGTPEYSHGYGIPIVALWFLALRAGHLASVPLNGSWAGTVLVLAALAVMVLGELSAVYTLIQYGMLLGVLGLVWAATSNQALRWLWMPLLFLVFMVPLPGLIENRLTGGMQLISSELGVEFVRSVGYRVFREGNVIDLGRFQLQVAEACSGMRYLFPLLSFGYLCAVLFRGRAWQRSLLVLAVVPITIVMNSIRIGITGILVNKYGISQAEGFLHYFEGWVIFMACLALLFLLMLLFARMERQPFYKIFALDPPVLADCRALLMGLRPSPPLLVAVVATLLAMIVNTTASRPVPLIPDRATLSSFPLVVGDWRGRELAANPVEVESLQATDTLLAEFRNADFRNVVMWVVYYESQVKGASVHSPQACLPAGGWSVDSIGKHPVPSVGPAGESRLVNRAVVTKGKARQLVYYWFAQRGRFLTNEFAVKWFIFWDGLTRQRTDGALVRITTHVPETEDLAAAEARLESFLRQTDPQLAWHLPDDRAPLRAGQSL